MRIKKYKSNQYILSQDGTWVRDPFKNSSPLDINPFSKKDFSLVFNNEHTNKKQKYPIFEKNLGTFKDVVIVSDGYDFENKQKILSEISNDVCILAVNGALKYWKLVGESCPQSLRRRINYYIMSNPYEESVLNLPEQHRYYPNCLTSMRTNPKFLQAYRGNKITFNPVKNENFSCKIDNLGSTVDDYRNVICASISLACHLKVRKLMLFCCDDSFDKERPSAIELQNGLWTYEQQIKSNQIIDALLYWLKKAGVEVSNYSSGSKLNNATYIKTEEEVKEFFEEQNAN